MAYIGMGIYLERLIKSFSDSGWKISMIKPKIK